MRILAGTSTSEMKPMVSKTCAISEKRLRFETTADGNESQQVKKTYYCVESNLIRVF